MILNLNPKLEERAQLNRITDKIVFADERMKRVERHAAELAEIDAFYKILEGTDG